MPDKLDPNDKAVKALARQLYERFGRSPLVGSRSWSQLKPRDQRSWCRTACELLSDPASVIQREEGERIAERLTRIIDEEHDIQAELEKRREDWMATRLSYCTGGLVNLRADLNSE